MKRAKFNQMLFKFFIRRVAQSHGFLDPLNLLTKLNRFAQPAEVIAPTELLRDGAILHARGLINSQAIQHNLDWVWPFWVERQFDPKDASFIPRAFSATHINLTHRNWTAIGVPECEATPIVDPAGLVMPFWDSWSLDAWIVTKDKRLIPSKLKNIKQTLHFDPSLSVITEAAAENLHLISTAQVCIRDGQPFCRIHLKGRSEAPGWLIVSVRPYNPEGISFVRHIEQQEEKPGFLINHLHEVIFDQKPSDYRFSYYREGDVSHHLFRKSEDKGTFCNIEMATGAALFPLEANQSREINVEIPLIEKKQRRGDVQLTSETNQWEKALHGVCRLSITEPKIQFLYDAALRTLVLHSVEDIYPGPYTYKRFWFRDAAFIVHSLLCLNLFARAKKHIDRFFVRQTAGGYFLSQEGEWDSNGEVLWVIDRFCELTNRPPEKEWIPLIKKAARWIINKRLKDDGKNLHSGLLPAGFSAEHFGPNDYYYWDNFFAVGGLKAAAHLMQLSANKEEAQEFNEAAVSLMKSVDRSLVQVSSRIGSGAIPASPYRRLDSGAVGSLAAGYPLLLFPAHQERLLQTLEFLYDHCMLKGGFFHDLSHSGVNAYLTLHMAQVLLRAKDQRYLELLNAVADAASPTGQWPEAIHPATKGGCMGDGQHVWAAAEWVLIIRNCFVREEEGELILLSGVPPDWYKTDTNISFGPAPTSFGTISIRMDIDRTQLKISWQGSWHGKRPSIVVHLPDHDPVEADEDAVVIQRKAQAHV